MGKRKGKMSEKWMEILESKVCRGLAGLLFALLAVPVLCLNPQECFADDAHIHCECGDLTCKETGEGHTMITFNAWTDADNLPSAAGNYYLDVDVTDM